MNLYIRFDSASSGAFTNLHILGGAEATVNGEPFDAMNETHLMEALKLVKLPRNVRRGLLKVGFFKPDEPHLGDPNDRVIDFTHAIGTPEGDFEPLAPHTVRARTTANIAVVRNPRKGSMQFAARASDSWIGVLRVYALGRIQPVAMFFIHLGRGCVLPRQGGKSVFETIKQWCLDQELGIVRSELTISGGIGPCCYRFEDATKLKGEVFARYGETGERIIGKSGDDPRDSFDMHGLIREEFEGVFGKIPEHLIQVFQEPTFCCACHPAEGSDFALNSQVRSKKTRRDLYLVEV